MRKPVLALAAMAVGRRMRTLRQRGVWHRVQRLQRRNRRQSVSRRLLRRAGLRLRAEAVLRDAGWGGAWRLGRFGDRRRDRQAGGGRGRERCWALSWDRASAVRSTARTRFMPGRPPPKPMRRRSERRSSGAIPIAAMRAPSGRPARVGPRRAPIAASSSSRSSSAAGCSPLSGRPASSRMVAGGSSDSGLAFSVRYSRMPWLPPGRLRPIIGYRERNAKEPKWRPAPSSLPTTIP